MNQSKTKKSKKRKTRKYKTTRKYKGGSKRKFQNKPDTGNETNEENTEGRVTLEIENAKRRNFQPFAHIHSDRTDITFMDRQIVTHRRDENGFTRIDFSDQDGAIGYILFKIIDTTFELITLYINIPKRNIGWGKIILYLSVTHAFGINGITRIVLDDQRGTFNIYGKKNNLYEKFSFENDDSNQRTNSRILVLTKEKYLDHQGDIEAYVRVGTKRHS